MSGASLRELDAAQRARLLRILLAVDPAPKRVERPETRANRIWSQARARRPALTAAELLVELEGVAEHRRAKARTQPDGSDAGFDHPDGSDVGAALETVFD